MGRAKILSSEPSPLTVVKTERSVKFVIPGNHPVGEFIRTEKRDNEIIIHYTLKPEKEKALIVNEEITVSFN